MRTDMLLSCIFLCLCETLSGNAFKINVTSRKDAIESYILSGSGKGVGGNCDILNVSPNINDLFIDTPKFVTDTTTLKTFDLKTALPNTQCLIVVAQVDDAGTLSHLIKFGLRVIENRKRMAMILNLGSNLSLEEANFENKTLPFVIAAGLDNTSEQILCPALGSYKSRLQSHMCDESEKSFYGNTGWSIWSCTSFCLLQIKSFHIKAKLRVLSYHGKTH